jgi:VWFA-related protein
MTPRILVMISAPLALSLVAATPPPVPNVEHIEVRLAQFDVVVRDKKGAIVTGLGRDEFTVFEDGSPLEIDAVDEWGLDAHSTAPEPPGRTTRPAGSEPPVPPPAKNASEPVEPERRSFVLVFDALGESTALRMNQAKRAAATFVRTHLRSNDLAAVYQLDLSLHAVSGVTSNVDEIARGIDKIAWMAASSLQDGIAESVLSSGSTGSTPLMKERLANLSVNASQQLDWQREHVYDSLNDLASLFRGLPGRRVLVLASPGFPMTTEGDRKIGAGGFTFKFRELIRSLAAYGVTVYSLDIGNDLAAGDASEKIDWRVAVGKLGMDENTLSDLGLERSMGSSSASARREFLGVIAAESGGRLLAQTDLSKAFDAIEEESTRFYRISCRVPVSRGVDRYRKLLISVKTPGYVVTSRRGRYGDITPQERALSGGLASVETLDRYRPLTSRGVALPLPGSDPKKIPVEVVIEALGPVQLPTDARGGAALDVEFRLVARVEGEVVDRYERSFTARVRPEGVAAIRNAFRVEGRLFLVPGIYEMQGSVRLGDPPQLASWSATVAVPPPAKGSAPVFAGVVLSAENEPESPLLSRPQIPEDADPLVLKPGARILPATHVDFEAGGSLLVLLWLKGVPEPGEKPPELDLSVNITDAEGKHVALPTKILFFGKEPSGGYRAVARIDAAQLTPGAYALRLSAGLAGDAGPPARRNVPFVVRAKETTGPAASATSSLAGAP